MEDDRRFDKQLNEALSDCFSSRVSLEMNTGGCKLGARGKF
jgi:hypothetical protein